MELVRQAVKSKLRSLKGISAILLLNAIRNSRLPAVLFLNPFPEPTLTFNMLVRASESLKNCQEVGDWPRAVHNLKRLLQNK
jgi:hypothetical protein